MTLAAPGHWERAKRMWPEVFSTVGGEPGDVRFVTMDQDGTVIVFPRDAATQNWIDEHERDIVAGYERRWGAAVVRAVQPKPGANAAHIALLDLLHEVIDQTHLAPTA